MPTTTTVPFPKHHHVRQPHHMFSPLGEGVHEGPYDKSQDHRYRSRRVFGWLSALFRRVATF